MPETPNNSREATVEVDTPWWQYIDIAELISSNDASRQSSDWPREEVDCD